jgi:8-oxo-dGTP diphosphatase
MESPTLIAIAVVQSGDRFLIGQRSEDVALGGYWEFPGGKVKLHETPEEAAVRECREETGLVVSVIDSYEITNYDYDHDQLRLHFFACEPSDPRQTIRNGFRWVTREELAEYRFPPANEKLLAELCGGNREV